MHSNNTQVQVQIPAAYYTLGSVAMNGNIGFGSGGGGPPHPIDHHSPDNNHANSGPSTTSPLHPYHPSNSALSGHFHHNQSSSHHHTHPHQYHQHASAHQSEQPALHGQQQQQQQQQPAYSGSSQQSPHHTYHADLPKTIPIQHQVDIYQPPHQSLDSDLMNPIVNRQLNNQYASNYHAPYNYHQHYASQHTPYQYNAKQQTGAQQQQHQQHQIEQSLQQTDRQQRSNASTPTPTLTSNLSTVSSASTPSLSSTSATLPASNDHFYHGIGDNSSGNSSRRQPSPASTSVSAFHVPTSPDQLAAVGPRLPSPLASHPVGMTQAMSNWTANNASSMDQELSSQQQQQSLSPVSREHAPLGTNASPKSDRPSSYLFSDPSQQHQQQQTAQAWVANMAGDHVHTPQEILEQDRHQHQRPHQHQPQHQHQSQHQHQHHQRSYSQSSRASSSALDPYASAHGHESQHSVPSQHTSLPAVGGLPLLSPTNMLQSEYQPSSYSLSMPETPTIMSHLDYNRVAPSMAMPSTGDSIGSSGQRYGGPIRGGHRKGRTQSSGSQRDFASRTRANSVNSTSSSVASAGVLSSLATTLSSTSIAAGSNVGLSATQEDEEEDSDSPTTIQMRPRANTAPRKALAARVFECSVPGCTKAYTQLHNLKSHERTGHTPVIKLKPFHCIIEGCAKAFSQRKSLALHIKTAHSEFKFKPFKCSQGGCSKAYTQLHNLRTHEKTVHLVDLSRKRVKNPSIGDSVGVMSGSSSCSPPFPSMDGRDGRDHYHHHHHQQQHHEQQQGQMQYHHHMDASHSGLGLSYDGLSELDLSGAHGESPYHPSQRQREQHQQHHAFGRMPQLNSMSSMYDHRP